MTYKLNKVNDPNSCIERQAATIHKLREESRKKTEALIKASKQITQLQGEKRELTGSLNRKAQSNNMRSDQNWDSRPRVEITGKSHLKCTEEGLHAINEEEPKKQVKMIHENGESMLIGTDDNWENSETLYRG